MSQFDDDLFAVTRNRQKRTALMPEGIMGFFTVVGLIVIVIFLGRGFFKAFTNTGDSNRIYALSVDNYYTPSSRTSNLSVQKMYSMMMSQSMYGCQSSSMLTSPNAVPAQHVSGTYDDVGSNCIVYDIMEDKYTQVLSAGKKSPMQIAGNDGRYVNKDTDGEISGSAITDVYRLIAPFRFGFDVTNTKGDTIIITCTCKGAYKHRITFYNVAGWFCVGNNPTAEDLANHTRHSTIVGNSANAHVSGGYPGNIIGYGDADTTVKFEVGTLETSGIYSYVEKSYEEFMKLKN